MGSSTDCGQVTLEVLWISLVVFSLLLFLTYFSFRVDEQQSKQQFQSWESSKWKK